MDMVSSLSTLRVKSKVLKKVILWLWTVQVQFVSLKVVRRLDRCSYDGG